LNVFSHFVSLPIQSFGFLLLCSTLLQEPSSSSQAPHPAPVSALSACKPPPKRWKTALKNVDAAACSRYSGKPPSNPTKYVLGQNESSSTSGGTVRRSTSQSTCFRTCPPLYNRIPF